MSKYLLTNQILPTDAGFKVISVKDYYGTKNKNYNKLKKWCRSNCTGIWGFTPQPIVRNNAELKVGAGIIRNHESSLFHYFAFCDSEDLLTIGLTFGTDGINLKSMWPMSCRFSIFVPDLT